jgi:hypothetical protein
MATYRIVTLVDITRTQPSRTETDKLKLAQQANFNSLCQAIGLRANFSYHQNPNHQTGSLPYDLDGKADHWIWEFETERPDIFLNNSDPVALLKQDLHGVPVINQLNNTADIDPAVFQTQGNNTNIWIYEITDVG